jgi:hypothetical protein
MRKSLFIFSHDLFFCGEFFHRKQLKVAVYNNNNNNNNNNK